MTARAGCRGREEGLSRRVDLFVDKIEPELPRLFRIENPPS
jgi:hypothetical protein